MLGRMRSVALCTLTNTMNLNFLFVLDEGLADNTPWICTHLRKRPGRMYHKGNRTNLQSFSKKSKSAETC